MNGEPAVELVVPLHALPDYFCPDSAQSFRLKVCRPNSGGRSPSTFTMPASLLYEATKALTQEELSALGSNGLLELCALDRRFHPCAGRLARALHEAYPTTPFPVLRVQV